MDDKIETFFNYLLDTEATSDIAFDENIHENNELFDSRYLNIWESLVNQKIQQVYVDTIVSTLNNVSSSEESESDDSEEEGEELEEEEDDDGNGGDEEKEEFFKEKKKDVENKIFRRIIVSIIS